MWTFDELDPQIDDIRERILTHGKRLGDYFVNRREEIELAVLCTAAQEPLLFVGAPGTAKSDLVVKFVESTGLDKASYFEYMLTKFTEPSEILGPIDLEQLKTGRFTRRTSGMLPEGVVVFLDEIFKSNSAILNTLLTILNERKFYQDGAPTPVALKMLFAATNEIPEQTELEALADRFVIKIETLPVKDTHFEALIEAGMRNEGWKATGQRPWVDGTASLEDYFKFKRYMDLMFSGVNGGSETFERWFPRSLRAEFRRVIRALEAEDKVYISDRKVVKLYKLICTRAFLFHGGAVQRDDLRLLCYVGNKRHELAPVAAKVKALLGLDA
ncbi:MAG: AAA family ATPase [Bradymonadia bacterium]